MTEKLATLANRIGRIEKLESVLMRKAAASVGKKIERELGAIDSRMRLFD